MLEPSASRFWQATLQSGLADAKALQACWDAIPAEKRSPEHIDRRLARQAVQSGLLTLWQAQQLITGRSVGFKIDRYVLIGLIGQGGMGRVYLAVDSRLNRRVALKILSPERVNNPRAIARFHREAMVGAQLQHENLVRIYDEGEAGGKCYLVMEYIEGRNIGQMIGEDGPIPADVAARLGRQVALGLEHAQRKGLIHRDVNPYNILVTRDGTAKLTDLGLAIDLADQERVTRDGATVGTFDYVSPEQARHSHSVDTRSDIYSLGCTLYHMLTGQVPFPSASLPEKLFSHQANDPEPMRNLAPDVPEGLAAAVSRMMRKSPDDRYASPLEVALALDPFADMPSGSGSGSGSGIDVGATARVGTRQEATLTVVSSPPSNGDPSAGPASGPAPAAVAPAPIVLEVPPPAVVEATLGTPPSSDAMVGFDLGVNLGPEEPLSSGPASARSRTKPEPKPKAKPPTAPAPAPEPATPAFWEVPDVAAEPTSGTPTPGDEGSLGFDLGVNLGPEAPLAKAEPPARPKPKPEPKARTEPAQPPAKPTPAPVVPSFLEVPIPAEEATSGSSSSGGGSLGFDLGVNLGPEAPLAKAKPKPEPKPKAGPAPPPAKAAPAPAPSPAPTVPAFLEVPSPAEEATSGGASPAGEGLGFDLGVNLGPEAPLAKAEPPARPKPKPEPAPKPKAESAAPPAKATPAPAPRNVPPPVVVEAAPAAPTNDEGLLGLGIGVNLGPEAPLSQSGSTARSKPKAEPKPKAKATPKVKPKGPTGDGRPPWVVPAAAAAGLLAVVIVGAVLYRSFIGGAGASTATAGKANKAGKTAAAGVGSKGKGKGKGAQAQVVRDMVVISPDGFQEEAPDLPTGMRMAIGSRGYLVLGNRTPLKIASAKPIVMGGNRLTIRAAEGVTPVLEVEVKGGKAFLSTSTECRLQMEGVTVVARYVDPGANPAPVIDAGGSVYLDRCTFRVEGAAPRARAVAMQGGTLTAIGCYFENFDRALDVACFAGSVMTMRQCMFVRTRADDPNTPPSGWAVRMRYEPGPPGKTGRRLVLDHCTARGQGFLDFVGFLPLSPVNVDLTGCAVLADALVSWSPETPTREALAWSGRGDLYDLRGQSWALLAPDNKPMPDGPGNLDAWSKTLGPETDPISPPLRFATDASSVSEHREPRDFAVISQTAQTPGADPTLVGPGARPLVPPGRKR